MSEIASTKRTDASAGVVYAIIIHALAACVGDHPIRRECVTLNTTRMSRHATSAQTNRCTVGKVCVALCKNQPKMASKFHDQKLTETAVGRSGAKRSVSADTRLAR